MRAARSSGEGSKHEADLSAEAIQDGAGVAPWSPVDDEQRDAAASADYAKEDASTHVSDETINGRLVNTTAR